MTHTQTHFDLRDAFQQPGCPACRLALATLDRWMNAIDYEFVGDPGFRGRLRAALGFCNHHAHQWLARAHVLGTAQIYLDVLKTLTAQLRVLHPDRAPALAGFTHLFAPRHEGISELEPSGPCPACQVVAAREAMVADSLVAGLADDAFRAQYMASAGLCLPHLRLALQRADDERVFAVLRDGAIARHDALLAELAEVIRRHDYRFAGEPWGKERDATARAVAQVAGALGIPDR